MAKKSNWGKKILVLIPILLMGAWVFAGAMSSLSQQTEQEEEQQGFNEFTVEGPDKSYLFYELADNTYGTYIYKGSSKIPIAFLLDPRGSPQGL